jgi:hypothetical protein
VLIFGVHTTEVTLLTFKLTEESAATRLDSQIKSTQELLTSAQRKAATRPTTRNSEYVTMYQSQLKNDRARREDTHNSFDQWHAIFFDIKTVLPKTTETVALLERMLISKARLEHVAHDSDDNSQNSGAPLNDNPIPVHELQAEIRSRSVGWIVGTSVGFEGVVLVLAAWLFCRRDY